jgi:hypothetical protein
MTIKGMFGYIIGRKKRLMKVHNNADLLWQILVREIYILLKHFNTKEEMRTAFDKIKITKSQPKLNEIEKFRLFTDLELIDTNKEWKTVLKFCESSFINILEAGYIVNDVDEKGVIFMLDFNKEKVIYYDNNLTGKTKEIQSATLDEILDFEDMPTKTYTEIVSEMKTNFNDFNDKYSKVEKELVNLFKLKELSKTQNDVNIEDKVNKLIDDMKWEKKKLNHNRKVFYNRLKSLDLIEGIN